MNKYLARSFSNTARLCKSQCPIEWVVIVYDKPGVDRLKYRPEHIAGIPANIENGTITNCGAIFKDAAKTQFIGSTFNVKASSHQEVVDFLSSDIYAKNGIWDMSNAIIHPYGVFKRLPN